MNETIQRKVREAFPLMVIYKDPDQSGSLFAGRNLPSFVKDYILQKYIDDDGKPRSAELTAFLDKAIPQTEIKSRLINGEELTLLARFVVYVDLKAGVRCFAIPDLGIKTTDGLIPESVYRREDINKELVDGEKWGVIKLSYVPNAGGKSYHVEMTSYTPFRPYRSIEMDFLRRARAKFTLEEWIDVLLSAMEYDADGFAGLTQKMEFLSRLLIFVEPRLNVIEFAPKGTGKSYVFGNISKYGWLVSGGRVTRAKLFYDKTRQQNGIIKNHDFTAFDEVQTIIFQEQAEIQAALKSYLESGKTTIDNNEFTSECGLMLMGNIPLTSDNMPRSDRYFDSLPQAFQESALLDRFHCFIEGWNLPRINTSIIFKGWTLNVEYFSEVLHSLRTQNVYNLIFDKIVGFDKKADTRDMKAVKRVCVAYMKLLFPHWTSVDDVNREEFKLYCLEPAVRRRGIIREQCHKIDQEFKTAMPNFWIKE